MTAAAPLPPQHPVADPYEDSRLEAHWLEQGLGKGQGAGRRPPQDRAARLLAWGLVAAVMVLLWLQLLASGPHLALHWQPGDSGAPTLAASSNALLKPWVGQPVQALLLPDGQRIETAAAGAAQVPRWIVGDASRAEQLLARQRIATALQQARLTLLFAPPDQASLPVPSRGLGGLGLATWLLAGLALALLLAAGLVVQSQPGRAAGLFALMALAQSLNLLLIAAELLPGLGAPAWLVAHELALRWGADLMVAAAMVHLAALYPQRLARSRHAALLTWGLAAALLAGLLGGWLPGAWWWAQGWTLGAGLVAVGLLQRSRQRHGGPMARLLQRLVLAAVVTLALLTAAQALADQTGPGPHGVALIGSVLWHVFVASLMLLGPFLSRSRRMLRELALLAGISSVATSLDLLFETVLDLGPGASLVAAVGLSAGLYAMARRWILAQLTGSTGISAERLFDSLYRVARALEPAPEQAERQITDLLREVFDPLEVSRSGQTVSRVRVTQDGSTLVVPIPAVADGQAQASAPGSIVLRHARQGRRLFSPDDLQLAERLIDQLGRAVAYDRAVERGRTEERTRIAQDLHDDIGARLLTLMYKAPNAEIEEYIRHTLQDLKTLTRGLAASNHRLSHAAAEWKADLSQRLTATGCDLQWSFSIDRDLTLNVVQWSGLTRVIRELVNNIISHARASQVEVSAQVDRGQFTLVISDDGIGREPGAWSHGLGLGGVRKRVKLLGGQVQWREATPRGIRCELRIPLRPTGAKP